jgi:hypothetical protein
MCGGNCTFFEWLILLKVASSTMLMDIPVSTVMSTVTKLSCTGTSGVFTNCFLPWSVQVFTIVKCHSLANTWRMPDFLPCTLGCCGCLVGVLDKHIRAKWLFTTFATGMSFCWTRTHFVRPRQSTFLSFCCWFRFGTYGILVVNIGYWFILQITFYSGCLSFASFKAASIRAEHRALVPPHTARVYTLSRK